MRPVAVCTEVDVTQLQVSRKVGSVVEETDNATSEKGNERGEKRGARRDQEKTSRGKALQLH